VQRRARRTRAELKGRLAVLSSILPDLYLNARQLAGDGARASLAATALGRALNLPSVPDVQGALNILGPATLNATDMAAWWAGAGYRNNSGVPILKLAQEYLAAGRAEGVAGDIAFAQAVLETGGFSSMSGANNFAGIGACAACGGGYDYPTYVAGIRAQVQLLHAYADKNLTPSQLVGGVAYHGISTLSVRGCCTTWPTLSATWSSGTHYGDIILEIYGKMLSYAAAHDAHNVR
jgi:hypothetical protein